VHVVRFFSWMPFTPHQVFPGPKIPRTTLCYTVVRFEKVKYNFFRADLCGSYARSFLARFFVVSVLLACILESQ
jgi:hypothetical protein